MLSEKIKKGILGLVFIVTMSACANNSFVVKDRLNNQQVQVKEQTKNHSGLNTNDIINTLLFGVVILAISKVDNGVKIVEVIGKLVLRDKEIKRGMPRSDAL
ncbi:MAG: hypothetical protein KAG28_06485 [Cocleimonas sp.]|nr:hypothetical protein [Cocleimonas sp.]